MKSAFGQINKNDLIKAVIVAALSSILVSILPILQAGNLPTLQDLQTIGIAGLASATAYLIKNYFTNSQDELLKQEPGSNE